MTRGRRALAGAALGALVTLLLHPVSRPFLLEFTESTTGSAVEYCLDRNESQPAPPKDLLGASQWVQLALERSIDDKSALRPGESQTVLGILDNAIRLDPDNAFWKQAKAVLLAENGDAEGAKTLWLRASLATQWNDYQSDRLMLSRDRIAGTTGAMQAWQLAYVYQQRSLMSVQAIDRFARNLIADAEPTTEEGLNIRYATLMNGNLIRIGARSVAIGKIGAGLVDLTTYPADLAKEPSNRSLWTGQTQMLTQMANLSPEWRDRSNRARGVFDNNEAWRALMGYEDPQNLPEKYSFGAILSAGVTGAVSVVGLVGILLWGLGELVRRRCSELRHLSWPVVGALAAILGIGGGFLMNDAFAGLTTLVCTLFLRVSPPNVRKARPTDLGPLFTSLVLTVATFFGGLVVAYLVTRTLPASMVFPGLGVATGYFQTPMLLGLASIPIGLLLLAVPMWSSAQRLPVPHVLGVALTRFGTYLAIGGLGISICLTPAAVFADRKLTEQLDQIVKNEPLFYYLRQ